MGSSPLTRGKLSIYDMDKKSVRLIPAHAGKTLPCDFSITRRVAHPRSRGENAVMNHPAAAALGSSPLTRGKHRAAASREIIPRLIPAHAGKTTTKKRSTPIKTAHPRSRGENFSQRRPGQRFRGSSPLTRGKLADAMDQTRGEGLIPAHAGKTSSPPLKSWKRRAHPRSRGENDALPVSETEAIGSSPLTRGKRSVREDERTMTGLIPAHAGKTSSSLTWARSPAAHPRSRGENT